eukprot:scaffold14149_cov73-Cylindrotheca_fusiformis.AAC.1
MNSTHVFPNVGKEECADVGKIYKAIEQCDLFPHYEYYGYQEMCETTTEEAWDAFKDNCTVVVAQATGRRNYVRTLARRTTLYHTM